MGTWREKLDGRDLVIRFFLGETIGLRKGLRGHATGNMGAALNLFASACKCLAKTKFLILNASHKLQIS